MKGSQMLPGNRSAERYCFIPPYLIRPMAESADGETRRVGVASLTTSAVMREKRELLARFPRMSLLEPSTGEKDRRVYDLQNKRQPLPPEGGPVRDERDASPSNDVAADEAFVHSGITYDFYHQVLGRNSLDGNGMDIVSCVHFGTSVTNAFWNGEQMIYGDGDGKDSDVLQLP